MPVASTLPRRACLALLLAFSCGTVSAASPAPAAAEAAAVPPQLHDLDAHVERVREQFDVPGISVAIVQDGEVVLERGYGVRKLGEPAKVDAPTQFAIASTTKAFTAASISILADEGKLKLEIGRAHV